MSELLNIDEECDDEDFLTRNCTCGRLEEWAMCEHDQDCAVYLTPKECHGGGGY